MHVISQYHELPQAFIDSDELDLYIYQAGHGLKNQSDNYRLAQQFLDKPVKRPIINSEPPYEGHGHGNLYGLGIKKERNLPVKNGPRFRSIGAAV
jgi:hypothetical protein